MATYTISDRDGCRIVTGDVPLSAFSMLISGMPKGAIVDTNLARMLNANLVIGAPEDIVRLKCAPDVLEQARTQVAGGSKQLSPAAQEWLATGEQGTSSKAMFARFTGIGDDSCAHPCDPDDFRRCRLLLEQVPEFSNLLPRMVDVSSIWSVLVDRWSDLVTIMDAEVPDWRNGHGKASKTYELMKSIGC